MKHLVTILLVCVIWQLSANPVYNKLTEVNKCWKEQHDVGSLAYPVFKQRTDREWISIHLSLVEQTLRNRNNPNLTKAQKENRETALNHLHQYWQDGAFPINDIYDYRTPIFIDKYNNFCAVGYLVKATGYEHVSRMIAAKTNLAYVREMKYPELFAWAKEYGFTVDELAWIQPSYPPTEHYTKAIGKGIDGMVNELYSDTITGRLYVGGKFKNVDGNIVANSIAYVTENNRVFTWHNMGTGVNGFVYAIAIMGNNVFVAGSFDTAGGIPAKNVAYWDGSSWHSVGCIEGIVKDLEVYKGELYAVGDFDICGGLTEVNFAKLTGSNWNAIAGTTGCINTMLATSTDLLLGGAFTHANGANNIVKWNETTGFTAYNNNLANEVKDLEIYHDTVYAGCNATAVKDSTLFARLNGNAWVSLYRAERYSITGKYYPQYVASLCV